MVDINFADIEPYEEPEEETQYSTPGQGQYAMPGRQAPGQAQTIDFGQIDPFVPEKAGIWGGAKELVKQLPKLPGSMWETTLRSYRGGDRSVDDSGLVDRMIADAVQNQREYRTLDPDEREREVVTIPFLNQTITLGDVEDSISSLGYSVVNMIVSQLAKKGGEMIGAKVGAVGGPIGAVVGGKAGGIMGGLAGGTAFSLRASKDQFLDQMKQQFMQTQRAAGLDPIELQTRWEELYDEIESDAFWYGAWEAGGETAGNMLMFGIAKLGKGAVTKPFLNQIKARVAKSIGARIALKTGMPVGKLGAMLTEETLTETLTQKKQGEIEAKQGLRDEAPTWIESFREVLPMVMITTPLLGGAAGVVTRVGGKVKEKVRPGGVIKGRADAAAVIDEAFARSADAENIQATAEDLDRTEATEVQRAVDDDVAREAVATLGVPEKAYVPEVSVDEITDQGGAPITDAEKRQILINQQYREQLEEPAAGVPVIETREVRRGREIEEELRAPVEKKAALKEDVEFGIPELKTTGEAIKFGQKATPAQVSQLKVLNEEKGRESKSLREAGDFQAAMDVATEGQFFREAVEAYEGKIKPKIKPAEKAKAPAPVKAKVAPPVQAFKADTGIPLYEGAKKKPEYHIRTKGIRASVEQLSPGQYLVRSAKALGITVKKFVDAANMDTVKKYADAMRKGDVFPGLSIEPDKRNQEGRHRALAARMLGIKKVPVTIIEKVPTLGEWRTVPSVRPIGVTRAKYLYDATGRTARQINRKIDAAYYSTFKIMPEKGIEGEEGEALKPTPIPKGMTFKDVVKEEQDIRLAKKRREGVEVGILSRLINGINNKYGAGVVEMDDLTAVQTDMTKAIKEISSLLGFKGVEFFESNHPLLSGIRGVHIMAGKQGRGIAINAKNENMIPYIFGHETWHEIQNELPEAAKKIQKYVMDNRDEYGYRGYHDQRQQAVRRMMAEAQDRDVSEVQENPISKDEMESEFMATFIGTRWRSKEFLDKMAKEVFKKQPTIMERILGIFEGIINKLKSAIPNYRVRYFVGEMKKLDELVIHAYKTMGLGTAARKLEDNFFDPEYVWEEGIEAIKVQQDLVQDPKIKTMVESRSNILRLMKKNNGASGLEASLTAKGVDKKNAARIGTLARNMEQWPFPGPKKTAKQLIKYDKKDPAARKWYEDTKWLERVFENEEDLDLFKGLALLTHTSRNKGTLANMVEFVKFRTQTKAGQKIWAPGLVDPETIDRVLNAETLSEMFKIGSTKLGFEEGEVKVKAFADTFVATIRKDKELRESLKAVVDIWVNRYYFPDRVNPAGDKSMALTPVMHHRIQEHIKEVQREIQKETGEFWYVDEIQASMWFYLRDIWAQEGTKDKQQVGYTFDETLVVMAQRWSGMMDVDDSIIQAYIDQKLRDPDVRHVLDHYTREENDFTVAFPDYQGTGIITGREWSQQDPSKPRPRRIHFYEAGRMPEPGLIKAKRMRAVIDSSKIYDLGKDEDGYRERFDTLTMGKPDQSRLADMENQMIKDGWIGFNAGTVTVMFEPTRVHPMKKFVVSASPIVEDRVIKDFEDVYPEQAARLKEYKRLEDEGKTEELTSYMKDDMTMVLAHPLIDIKGITGADGRWEGGNEFAVFVELESGNVDILRGRIAEFLLNNAQLEGLISEVKSEVGDYSRPAGVSKSQGPSIILKFKRSFTEAELEKISSWMGKSGIFGSTYIKDQNALILHHLLYRDNQGKIIQTEDQFLNSTRQFAADIQNDFKDIYEGYGSVWFKHEIMKNNWVDKSVKSGPNKYSPKGEAYESIIQKGKVTARNLGFIAWPRNVQGVYGEDVPALDRYPSLLTGPTSYENQKPAAKKAIDKFLAKKKTTLQDFEIDRIKQWIKNGMADSISVQDRGVIKDLQAAGDPRVKDIKFPALQETLPFVTINEDVDLDTVHIPRSDIPINKSWKTYRDGELEADKNKNILVKGGKGKQALIQISSNMAREEATQDGDGYFDKLYGQRVGYDRPSDFWEIPEWMGRAAKTFPDSDVYVVRNVDEAVEYLNQAGYDSVMFSAMDANKDVVKNIASRFDGKSIVGGYVDPKYFKGVKGVDLADSIQSAAKSVGVKYVEGVDYRHFKGSKTIPRLECSSGCLHKCAFCTVPKKILLKTNAEIDAQVAQYKDLDYKLVYLNDKTFGQGKNYEYIVDVNKRIKKENPNFKGFVIQTTAPQFNKMDDEFLKESGIKYVELGVESFNDDILSKINKPHRTKQIREAADKIRRNDMIFIPNVMVGLAGTTKVKAKPAGEVYWRGAKTGDLKRKGRRGAFYFAKEKGWAEQYGPASQWSVNVANTFDYRNDQHLSVAMRALRLSRGYEAFMDDELRAGDWEMLEKPEVRKALQAAGFDSYRTSEAGDVIGVFNMKDVRKYEQPGLWSETEKSYQNTLDFLNEQADIISHVNVYVLAVYEGTSLSDQIGTGQEADSDENVINKSWMENQDLHQGFYRDVLDFAQERLDHGDVKKVMKKPSEDLTVLFDVAMPDAKETIDKKIGPVGKKFSQRVADGVGDVTENWRYKYLDRVDPIRQKLGGEYGAAYMHARGIPGVRSSMTAYMEHGKLKFDDTMTLTTDTRKQGFISFLNSLGKDSEKFFYWLVAKRAEALEKEDREKWLLKPDRDKIFAWTGEYAEDGRRFSDINKEFQAWNDSVLDIAIESGLLTKTQVDNFRQEFYIPFYRIMEDQESRHEFLKGPGGGKGLNLSAQIKRLEGAEARIGDPVENIMKNWTHLIGESVANVARREAAEYAIDNELVTEAGEPLVEEVNWTDTVIFKPGKKDRGKQVIFVHKKTGEQVLSYREKGKAKFIRINDPELFGAMSNMNRPSFRHPIMTMFSGSRRLLTFGATFGPAFKIKNMIRDSLHTFLISRSFKPFIDTARGVVKAWKEDDEMIKFLASGHAFGGSYIKAEDPGSLSKYIDRLVKKEGEDFWGRLLNTPAKMMHFWERLGDASENAARVALYSNLRAKGKTHLESAFRARDLMDFQMSGAAPAVQFLIQTIPFLNARTQGLYRMGRGLAEDPKVFLAKGAAITAASMGLWLAYKDDDRYKELEDWEKWTYYHFWIGDKHYRIPKPFETGVIFSSLFESAGNVLAGDEEFEHFLSFLKHAFTETLAFNPLLGIQLIKPIFEQWANKVTFTGRPIEGQSLEGLKWGERYDPWTSETLRLAGKLGIPPKRAEVLIRGYFSTFGLFILGISDILVRNVPFLDFPERPDRRIEDYPLIGAFIRETPPRNVKTMTAFYDTMKELEETVRTINMFKRTGRMDDARKLATDEAALLRMRKKYSTVKRELSAINREIRRTWLDKNMSGEDKKKWIDARLVRKNKLVTDIYNAHKEMK